VHNASPTTAREPRRVRPRAEKAKPLPLADALRRALERTDDVKLRAWLVSLLAGDDGAKK
jgi:hypothetical protein